MQQMEIPFRIAASGAVATVDGDPVRALADRVRAMVATAPGERVMRVVFGVATADIVFGWDENVGKMQLGQRVEDAVRRWEPSARVIAALPVMSADGSQVVGVNVDISAGDPVMASEAAAQYPVVITSTGEVIRTR